jgi:hypothetical protein
MSTKYIIAMYQLGDYAKKQLKSYTTIQGMFKNYIYVVSRT